jgi:hypothetical protein
MKSEASNTGARVPVIACEKCFRERVSEGRHPITDKYRHEQVKNYTDLNRDCSCSRFDAGSTISGGRYE